MATRITLWRLNADGSATAVPEKILSTEEQVESAIESESALLGIDVLFVARQARTTSGVLDLLALDGDGRLVVIEIKRDRTPRTVVAQAIDYAAWADTLTFDDVAALYTEYAKEPSGDATDLATAYEERFGTELDAITEVPRMIVVASRLDDSTEKMIDFLADNFRVPINAVLFQPFEGNFLGQTLLRSDESDARVIGRKSASTNESREATREFWQKWLPVARPKLNDINLPKSAPTSVLIKRRIVPNYPGKLTVWISSSEAFAELQYDDSDSSTNMALLTALELRKEIIESEFGEELDWRTTDIYGHKTKRTAVVTRRLPIGDRTEPTAEELERLTGLVRRLVDAMRPHIRAVTEQVAAQQDNDEAAAEEDDPVGDEMDQLVNTGEPLSS